MCYPHVKRRVGKYATKHRCHRRAVEEGLHLLQLSPTREQFESLQHGWFQWLCDARVFPQHHAQHDTFVKYMTTRGGYGTKPWCNYYQGASATGAGPPNANPIESSHKRRQVRTTRFPSSHACLTWPCMMRASRSCLLRSSTNL